MPLLEGRYEVEEEEEREEDGFHSDSENVDYLLLTTLTDILVAVQQH